MIAADKFDISQGTKFSTYATWRIKQAITRAIANKGSTIRIPVHMAYKIYDFKRTKADLEQKLSDTDNDTVAESMGISEREVKKITEANRVMVSLDEGIGDDGDTLRGDLIEDVTSANPENLIVEKKSLREALLKLIDEAVSQEKPKKLENKKKTKKSDKTQSADKKKTKTPKEETIEREKAALRKKAAEIRKKREKEIMMLRFGMYDKNEQEQTVEDIGKLFGTNTDEELDEYSDYSEPATLEELGRRYGITGERIRQIESSVLRKLRQNPQVKELGMSYIGSDNFKCSENLSETD